jgi:transcriptional regulator with XRE-family HTH domain
MSSPQNPFRRLRGGLSLHEFATLLGVSISVLQQLERGVIHVSKKVLQRLDTLGFDCTTTQEEYDVWRVEQQKKTREKLQQSTSAQAGGAA